MTELCHDDIITLIDAYMTDYPTVVSSVPKHNNRPKQNPRRIIIGAT
jgi:hypothetical protein